MAILAYVITRSSAKTKGSRFPHLKGWQKVFGVLAIILTIFIIINPEFLARGLIGDTAFIDLLIFALSLQLHVFATRAFRICVDLVTKSVRWLAIPSAGTLYLLALITTLTTGAVAAFQKAVHRFLS